MIGQVTGDAVKSLSDVSVILNFAEKMTGGQWVVVLVLLVGFFLNKNMKDIFGYFQKKGKSKLEDIEKYIERNEASTSDMIDSMKDVRDAFYFKIMTGVYVEGQRRLALIRFHKEYAEKLSWKKISRAYEYLDFEDLSSIKVKRFGFIDKAGYYYNSAMGWVFMVMAILLVASAVIEKNTSWTGVVDLACGAFIAIVSLFVFGQNYPMKAAKEIKEMIGANETQK